MCYKSFVFLYFNVGEIWLCGKHNTPTVILLFFFFNFSFHPQLSKWYRKNVLCFTLFTLIYIIGWIKYERLQIFMVCSWWFTIILVKHVEWKIAFCRKTVLGLYILRMITHVQVCLGHFGIYFTITQKKLVSLVCSVLYCYASK